MDADFRPDASPGIVGVDADLRLGAQLGIATAVADVHRVPSLRIVVGSG